MAIRARQLWINGVTRWCEHPSLDVIRSEAGEVLAEVCSRCQVRVAEWGKCAGCGQVRRLTYFVASKRKAYHSEDCYRAKLAATRKAAEEKAAK
jgi:hypothetical protein